MGLIVALMMAPVATTSMLVVGSFVKFCQALSTAIYNSNTIESRDQIRAEFGLRYAQSTAWKEGAFGLLQKTYLERVCIGMIKAFLLNREPPKGLPLTRMSLRALMVELPGARAGSMTSTVSNPPCPPSWWAPSGPANRTTTYTTSSSR